MTWKEAHEKYKDYRLPELNEVFKHPTQFRGDRLPIEYKVIEYKGDKGVVLTVHSNWKSEKTLHWIKKMYNTCGKLA